MPPADSHDSHSYTKDCAGIWGASSLPGLASVGRRRQAMPHSRAQGPHTVKPHPRACFQGSGTPGAPFSFRVTRPTTLLLSTLFAPGQLLKTGNSLRPLHSSGSFPSPSAVCTHRGTHTEPHLPNPAGQMASTAPNAQVPPQRTGPGNGSVGPGSIGKNSPGQRAPV